MVTYVGSAAEYCGRVVLEPLGVPVAKQAQGAARTNSFYADASASSLFDIDWKGGRGWLLITFSISLAEIVRAKTCFYSKVIENSTANL